MSTLVPLDDAPLSQLDGLALNMVHAQIHTQQENSKRINGSSKGESDEENQLQVRDSDDEGTSGDNQFGESKDDSRDKECSGSINENESGAKTGRGDMRDELEGMFVHADVVFDKVHILYLAWLWIHPMSISHLFLDKNLQLQRLS